MMVAEYDTAQWTQQREQHKSIITDTQCVQHERCIRTMKDIHHIKNVLNDPE